MLSPWAPKLLVVFAGGLGASIGTLGWATMPTWNFHMHHIKDIWPINTTLFENAQLLNSKLVFCVFSQSSLSSKAEKSRWINSIRRVWRVCGGFGDYPADCESIRRTWRVCGCKCSAGYTHLPWLDKLYSYASVSGEQVYPVDFGICPAECVESIRRSEQQTLENITCC